MKLTAVIIAGLALLLLASAFVLCKANRYYVSSPVVVNCDTITCEAYSLGVFGGGYKEIRCNGRNVFMFDQMANVYVGDSAGQAIVLSFDGYQKSWKPRQCHEILFVKLSSWEQRNSLKFKITQVDEVNVSGAKR